MMMARNRSSPSETIIRGPSNQARVISVRSPSFSPPKNKDSPRPSTSAVSALWRKSIVGLCISCSVYVVIHAIRLQASALTSDHTQVSALCAGGMRCFTGMQSWASNGTITIRGHLDYVSLPLSQLGRTRMRRPNYGGLKFRSSPGDASNTTTLLFFVRTIQDRDSELYHQERLDILDDLDSRVGKRDAAYDHYDDLDWPQTCYRARSTYTLRPCCIAFHERPVVGGINNDPRPPIRFLGLGSYRLSWSLPDVNDTDVVLKNIRFRDSNLLDPKAYAQVHKEAFCMERTTSSDRTVDIYGHCGISIFVERAFPIQDFVVPRYSYDDEPSDSVVDTTSNKNGDVQPRNNLTAEQKLSVALAMAEGLALLHGNFDGVIVNDDIKFDQWLLGRDGKLKLNDFNKAVIVQWNPESQSYCPFYTKYSHPYRAPEQLLSWDVPVDEKADVFAFGHNLYTLLTGLPPFYELGSREGVIKANKRGYLPLVDRRYLNRSFIEGRLVKIMEPCYQHRPEDRTSMFEVVAHLRATVQMYEERYPNATRIKDVSLFDLTAEDDVLS